MFGKTSIILKYVLGLIHGGKKIFEKSRTILKL
jgi:hypothetical protein